MPLHTLNDRAIRAATPGPTLRRLTDGRGLMLEVRPSGGKAWTFRFMLRGRRRDMGLGNYPDVSLSAARKAAGEARAILARGEDPIIVRAAGAAAREAERAEAEAAKAAEAGNTFRTVAERYIAAHAPGWTSPATGASWRWTMDTYAYPALGDRPVGKITREDVTAVLLPLRQSRPATSSKVQRRIAVILDLAVQLGMRTLPNVATARALRLSHALPALPPERQQASLPWHRVPAFMRALDAMEGTAPLALRFGILSGVRSAEVRGALWSELDVSAGLWTLAPTRMKGGKRKALAPHRVPLSPAMLATLLRAAALRTGEEVMPNTLDAVARLAGDAPIFPAPKGSILSDMALSAVIVRMNRREDGKPGPWRDDDGRGAVPHGFRRTFRTWVDDTRPDAGEAAEKALAHRDADKVRAAYRGSDLFAQRVPLMAAWGAFATGADAVVATSAPGAAASA